MSTTELAGWDEIRAAIVRNLPEEDYYSNPALSASGAKLLLKAPALFRHRQDHPKTSKAFDFGHAAHTKVLGVGKPAVAIPDEVLASNGAASTVAAKAFIAGARAAGQVPLKSDEVAQIDAMADQLASHTLAMRLLSEGEPEVSLFAQHEAGVGVRGRLDWLSPRIVTDYKTSTSADPNVFARVTAPAYGYHISAANYLDLCAANDLDVAGFAFIVQEKEPPYLVEVIELDDEAIARGRELMSRAAEIFRDCTAAGTWPGYGRVDRWTTVSLPPWALRDDFQHEEHFAS